MDYLVKMNFLLFDNFFDIIFGLRFVFLIKLKEHMFEFVETDELMFAMELIDACQATETTGLTFFVKADHENFFIVSITLGTASINATVRDLHEFI